MSTLGKNPGSRSSVGGYVGFFRKNSFLAHHPASLVGLACEESCINQNSVKRLLALKLLSQLHISLVYMNLSPHSLLGLLPTPRCFPPLCCTAGMPPLLGKCKQQIPLNSTGFSMASLSHLRKLKSQGYKCNGVRHGGL